MVSSLDYLDSVNKLQQAEEKYYALQRNFVFAVDEYESRITSYNVCYTKLLRSVLK